MAVAPGNDLTPLFAARYGKRPYTAFRDTVMTYENPGRKPVKKESRPTADSPDRLPFLEYRAMEGDPNLRRWGVIHATVRFSKPHRPHIEKRYSSSSA